MLEFAETLYRRGGELAAVHPIPQRSAAPAGRRLSLFDN
jgi:hypothetical protein